MGQIKEYIKIAIMNIRHNRGRSILTMLGIIIGISSVIMVISLGNGVSESVNSELDGLGGGQVVLYVDGTRKDTYVTFSMDDVNFLKNNIEDVNGISTYDGLWGTCESPKVSMDVYLTGATPDYFYNSKQPMVKGRYYNQSDLDSGASVCVVTETSAKKLFGTTDVVGLSFDATVWGILTDIKIIGVRKDSAGGLISLIDGDQTYIEAEVPLTLLENKFGLYTEEISTICIYCKSPADSVPVAANAKRLLENRHHCQGDNQILVENFADVSDDFSQIMSIITIFISFVAAISLVVGGIGVMNIMLVSVTERTREIGIRKSLGARTKSIMWQFLAEAGIITLVGGLVGIAIGIIGAKLIGLAVNLPASVDLLTIIIASLFSCGIGIFFGIYPAKKAARLNPIEALRHE